jgi:hypothetical protein
MSNDMLGLSFSPMANQGTNGSGNGNAVPTPQEAIRILSLRLPRTVGVASPIPSLLLNAPGGAGFSGHDTIPGGMDETLRRLFGLFQTPNGAGAGQPPMFGNPTPMFSAGSYTPPSAVPSLGGGRVPVPGVKPGVNPSDGYPQPFDWQPPPPVTQPPAAPREPGSGRPGGGGRFV